MGIVPHDSPSLFDGKNCSHCKQWKLLPDFYNQTKSTDGHASWCKQCVLEARRRYHVRNAEQIRARTRTWYANNQEKVLAWRAGYRARHAAYKRKARQRPETKLRELLFKHRRRVRARETGTFTPEQWHEMKAQYEYRCLCCGQREPDIRLTIDHVLPLSLGGRNDVSNIQPLCQVCNSRKNNRMIDYR